ncbi:hypothetical protein RMATCC62417_12050 [Rhizopus microsporus]|nr:hypothetical protein RMATCC62417_12050 [Rhizopus microsporus]
MESGEWYRFSLDGTCYCSRFAFSRSPTCWSLYLFLFDALLGIAIIPFNVYSEITPAHTPTEEHDLNPISHIQRRRSTITVSRTNNWRLTQRRGHSAMYAAIDSLKKDYQTLYIGGTGSIFTDENDPIEVNDISEEERDSLTSLLLSKYDMLPIFVEDKLASGHYEGYSKQVLWPLMHYLMWSDNVDEIAFWKDYVKVNEIFAQEAINHYNDGDISKLY